MYFLGTASWVSRPTNSTICSSVISLPKTIQIPLVTWRAWVASCTGVLRRAKKQTIRKRRNKNRNRKLSSHWTTSPSLHQLTIEPRRQSSKEIIRVKRILNQSKSHPSSLRLPLHLLYSPIPCITINSLHHISLISLANFFPLLRIPSTHFPESPCITTIKHTSPRERNRGKEQ